MSRNTEYSKFKPLITVSLLYLLLIIIISIGNFSKIGEMAPNEWGDYLAGTFAPLAFMWLVFGYYQQGEELKQNTAALKLQAEELRRSVQEQRQLVEVTNKELKLSQQQFYEANYKEIILAQPYFHFSEITLNIDEQFIANSMKLNFKIHNSRAICRDLRIHVEVTAENGGSLVTSKEIIKNGDDNIYNCSVDLNTNNFKFKNNQFSEKIIFRYQDALDNMQNQKFIFTLFQNDDNSENLSIDHFFINRYSESYKENKNLIFTN